MKELNDNYFDKNQSVQKEIQFEDLLKKGEKILWKGRPKKFSYALSSSIKFFPFALIWALIDFGFIFAIINSGVTNKFLIMFLIPFFALHLFPVWLFIGMFIKGFKDLKGVKYIITNRRVVVFRNYNQFELKEIEIENLSQVKLTRGVIDKMLKVGDIEIQSDISEVLKFSDVFDSEFLTKKLNEIILNKSSIGVDIYKEHFVCEHCGSYCDINLSKCPNCGASREK